jgi:hypothetical protein
MEGQNVPIYISMGNHDWYVGHGKHWIKINEKYPFIVYPNYYYLEQATNEVCVVALETNKDDMFKDQISWFAKQKEILTDCPFTIGFGHNPYYSAGQHGNASGKTKELLDKTVIGRVDVYVAGHDHNLEDAGEKNGTRLFVSGCAGKKRSLDKTPKIWGVGDQVGYLVLDVIEQNAKFKFVTVEKEKITVRHSGTINGKGLRP